MNTNNDAQKGFRYQSAFQSLGTLNRQQMHEQSNDYKLMLRL
jgi:hypothetical protein